MKKISSEIISCTHKDRCSGCQYIGMSYEKQADLKTKHLSELLSQSGLPVSKLNFVSAGAGYQRDRLDFSIGNGCLGLYQKDQREILDIDVCPQLSPALQDWLTEFRTTQWPFNKGSVRLRVGPQGQRGVWLDFANIDIKTLLDEKKILLDLQSKCFVEIGQRRRVPLWNGKEFKLRDPELNIWFQTWMNDYPVNLYCQVASFTQPSLKANKLICDILNKWIQTFSKSRLIEFGSGIGNLTLPALINSESVLACEIDELSLQGLQKTLENLPVHLQKLRNKIQIHRGDFQKKLMQDFSQFDGVLANPPRSGLMNFLNPLESLSLQQRPPFFIYMSCFPESMVKDMGRLKDLGYEIKEMSIIDQFPQTAHYEVLSLLQRKES